MASVKWTDEQQAAIDKKGSNILVAAAAGSGKTAVLVERIIKKIIVDRVDIDKILVVTFTNAAASEMRERILEAIYKKIEENPEDANLQKQIILLTGNDSEREAQIEQQLRELTLLPLNIKHMSVKAFLQTGAPRGAALIIAPYTMPLPLFSPPLIYTDLTLTTHQQEQIRKMLESA